MPPRNKASKSAKQKVRSANGKYTTAAFSSVPVVPETSTALPEVTHDKEESASSITAEDDENIVIDDNIEGADEEVVSYIRDDTFLDLEEIEKGQQAMDDREKQEVVAMWKNIVNYKQEERTSVSYTGKSTTTLWRRKKRREEALKVNRDINDYFTKGKNKVNIHVKNTLRRGGYFLFHVAMITGRNLLY